MFQEIGQQTRTVSVFVEFLTASRKLQRTSKKKKIFGKKHNIPLKLKKIVTVAFLKHANTHWIYAMYFTIQVSRKKTKVLLATCMCYEILHDHTHPQKP